jgi:hypothetical protein
MRAISLYNKALAACDPLHALQLPFLTPESGILPALPVETSGDGIAFPPNIVGQPAEAPDKQSRIGIA